MNPPDHERLDMPPRVRFVYAFRTAVTDIDPDALASLVGAVLSECITPHFLMAPEIQQAAQRVLRLIEPGILESLETDPVGRLEMWKAIQNREDQ